jgi:hypothetical protein
MFEHMTFDELNRIVGKNRSEPYQTYFGEMDLTEEEIEERIVLAEKLEENFLFVLALLFTMVQYNSVNYEQIRNRFEKSYLKAICGTIVADDYINQYIRNFSYDITDSTKAHADDMYYYSSDRAIFMAENESLTCWNHQDFSDAIKSGKRRKQWMDVRDKKERETHLQVGRTIKPIDQPFVVGGFLMQHPKDTSLGANSSQIVNCRCTIKYF